MSHTSPARSTTGQRIFDALVQPANSVAVEIFSSNFQLVARRCSQDEIVAVGPGGRDEAGRVIPIDLKVGDRVLFGKWSGTKVKIDNVELLIMKEGDIVVAKKIAA